MKSHVIRKLFCDQSLHFLRYFVRGEPEERAFIPDTTAGCHQNDHIRGADDTDFPAIGLLRQTVGWGWQCWPKVVGPVNGTLDLIVRNSGDQIS